MYITNENPPNATAKKCRAKYKHYPIEKLSPGQCLNIFAHNNEESAVRMAISRHKKKSKTQHKYTLIVDNSLIKVYCSKM